MSAKRNNRRLSVQVLEDRSVPASFSYTAGTLTITAEEGENLFVGNSNNAPAGYLRVVSVQSEFDSAIDNQPISNIIVKMGSTNFSTINFNSVTFIPGSVSVFGAKQSTQVGNNADIGKNFSFQAAATDANDIVTLGQFGSVGGNATIKMGNGSNLMQLTGGTVGGNMVIAAGAGNDTIVSTVFDDVIVNGSTSINLGGGLNQVASSGNHDWTVGKDFTFTGGAGRDLFDMVTGTVTTLEIGGKAKFALGKAGGVQNELELGGISVGGSLTISAGKEADLVTIRDFADVGGAMSVSLGDGSNSFDIENLNSIGAMTYTGGVDADNVDMNGFHVGKNLTVNAKGSKAGVEQILNFGNDSIAPNTVIGSMTVKGGNVNHFIRVNRTTIGGNLKVKLGERADELSIDDTSVTGWTLFDLGAGGDQLSIDNLNADSAGNLPGLATFGGTFTVKAGDGNDFVALSSNGGNYIKFGGKVSLLGGTGTDTFNNTIFNEFYSTGNSEDFETDAGTAIPA